MTDRLVDFFLEEPRATVLLVFGLMVFALGAIYRFVIWSKPIPMQRVIHLKGLEFREIGPQSPEQYEVYLGDRTIGYVRYRFGNLSADFPDVGMETVFSRSLKHETGQMTDAERGRWLPVIARRLSDRLAQEP